MLTVTNDFLCNSAIVLILAKLDLGMVTQCDNKHWKWITKTLHFIYFALKWSEKKTKNKNALKWLVVSAASEHQLIWSATH